MSSTQLKRSSFLAATATVFLADDCPHKARRLAGEMAARVRSRIQSEIARGYGFLNQSEPITLLASYKEAINFITQAYRRETAALLSLKNYSCRDELVDRYFASTVEKLKSLAELESYYLLTCQVLQVTPQKIMLTDEEERAARIFPRRNEKLIGPPGWTYLRDKLKDKVEVTKIPITREDNRITYDILNFIDGKNGLLDIRNAVSAEFKPVPIGLVEEYIRLLAQAGVVILKN